MVKPEIGDQTSLGLHVTFHGLRYTAQGKGRRASGAEEFIFTLRAIYSLMVEIKQPPPPPPPPPEASPEVLLKVRSNPL